MTISANEETSGVRALKQIPSFEVLADELHALLKAAAIWACPDTTRPHLNAVRIEVEKRDCNRLRVISTNGHAMYIGHCTATTLREGAVSLTLECVDGIINATKPATKKKASPLPVVFSGIDRTVKISNLSVILGVCEEDFPPYEKVVPRGAPYGLKDGFVGLNLKYLGMVAKTFPGNDGAKLETYAVEDKEYATELDPLVFRGETVKGEDAQLVLMPMRV